VGDEVEDVTALEAKGVDGRQDALDEAVAATTVGAEGRFPPEDSATEHSLGVVVGGLDTRAVDESPQTVDAPKEIAARALDLLDRHPAAKREQSVKGVLHRLDELAKELSRASAVASRIPEAEYFARDIEEFRREPLGLGAKFTKSAKCTHDVGPAELPLLVRCSGAAWLMGITTG